MSYLCGCEVRDIRTACNLELFAERGKVKAIKALTDEEKKTVFSIVDAFTGKKKLKDVLSGVLNDVK